MRPVEILMRVATAIFCTASLSAQTLPDFSGRWIVAPEPAASAAQAGGRGASGTMGTGWGVDITVKQDATTLTVEYAQFARGDMQPPMTFVYLLNGSESKHTINVGRGPQEQVSRASWDGNKLVITTTHTFVTSQSGKAEPSQGGKTMTSETTRVLSLESPVSLVVETTRSAVMGGQPSTTKTTYKKN
jgi:hypothetical protein